jgi:hypothetical protein
MLCSVLARSCGRVSALARYGPNEERFDLYFFILFMQCGINALMAVVGMEFSRRCDGELYLIAVSACWLFEGRKPWSFSTWKPILTWKYAAVSTSYMLAMYLSNAALMYVPYPTQVHTYVVV